MERFDERQPRRTPRRRRRNDLIWNILAALLLIMTICVVGIVINIYLNPNSALNPFPPATLIPSPAYPTATSTLQMTLQPSWTPTVAIPTLTPTIGPTNTPLVTVVPTELVASNTPTVIDFDFVLKETNPLYIAGETFHSELECNWVGVAGQVLGLNEEPIRSLFIHLGGSLESQTFDLVTITGSAPIYGAGGYEFIINQFVGSAATLWVQLEDVQGLPMSARIYFDTHADCQRNLALIYLLQVR